MPLTLTSNTLSATVHKKLLRYSKVLNSTTLDELVDDVIQMSTERYIHKTRIFPHYPIKTTFFRTQIVYLFIKSSKRTNKQTNKQTNNQVRFLN